MILAAVIVFVAAFIQGLSGFGYALVATPLLTFIFAAKSVVVMNIILGAATNVIVLLSMRRHVDVRRLAFMSLGGILGIPLGAYVLSRLDPAMIKIAIAVLAVPFAVLLLLGHSRRFGRDNVGCVVAGFVSGVIGASTSFSGPPVVLFLLNQGLHKEMFVGTLAAFFLFISLASIGAFSSLSMLTSDLLTRVALLLPALFLGIFIGVRLLPRINATVFRRVAASVVCVSAFGVITTVFVKL